MARRSHRSPPRGLAGPLLALLLASCGGAQSPVHLCFRPAPELRLPGYTDSNSPALWVGGKLRVFHGSSTNTFSDGASLTSIGTGANLQQFSVAGEPQTLWLEATYRRPRETKIFGIYHFESGRTDPVRCGQAGFDPRLNLGIPMIGVMVSSDGGTSWTNLGVILSAPDSDRDCAAQNGDFASGNGDPDLAAVGQYLYIYYGNYGGPAAGQGISAARILIGDLDAPVGKAWKWDGVRFTTPGLGGASVPIGPAFTAKVPYGGRVDSFWGPSIHYNTTLHAWVMAMNRTRYDGPWYGEEGAYVSFSQDAADPVGWSAPVKFSQQGGQANYPEFIGEAAGDTDRRVGSKARYFQGGSSRWEVEFLPGLELPDECLGVVPPAP
jgi:hypothetical protein